MLVSVVIPAYNAGATLSRCVEACLNQTYGDIEVIVVDDGSSDDTVRVAQRYPVQCVQQENRGPAAARNQGARVARGEVLAFTDADCFPDRDWIERLMSGFKEGVAGVGGTYAIANPGHLLAQLVHEEIIDRHDRFHDEVDFLGTFNVAYSKDAFEAAGGFDECFTMASGEDNDLAYRLADRGGKLRFIRDARVAHVHPTRLVPYLQAQFYHGFWRMRLYAKHPKRARRGDRYAGFVHMAAAPLALLTLLGFGSAIAAALSGHFSYAAACIAAVPALAYLAVYAPMQARMVRRTKDRRLLSFLGMAWLRDLARAFGMIRGLWRFHLLGRESA